MTAYRVTHEAKRTSFYVQAGAPLDALAIVVLKLGGTEGDAAWQVTANCPKFPVKEGVIVTA